MASKWMGLLTAGLLAAVLGARAGRPHGEASEAPVADRAAQRPAAPRAVEARKARLAASAPWGSAPGAVGHEIPVEGAPLGPMSFAVDERGVVHALDTVNGRVSVLGPEPRAIPLPSLTIDDLELLGDGYVALDRQGKGALHFLDHKGAERGRVELEGPEIAHAGLVSAVFVLDSGVWVEVEHRRVVLAATQAGLPVERRSVMPGRFTADGRGLLSAARRPPAGVQVTAWSAALAPRPLAALSFDLPVAMITALESHRDGGLTLGVELHRGATEAPFRVVEARKLLVGLGADGAERYRVEVPLDEGPEENLRPVRAGRDGAVYAMVFRKAGVEFWQVKP